MDKHTTNKDSEMRAQHGIISLTLVVGDSGRGSTSKFGTQMLDPMIACLLVRVFTSVHSVPCPRVVIPSPLLEEVAV